MFCEHSLVLAVSGVFVCGLMQGELKHAAYSSDPARRLLPGKLCWLLSAGPLDWIRLSSHDVHVTSHDVRVTAASGCGWWAWVMSWVVSLTDGESGCLEVCCVTAFLGWVKCVNHALHKLDIFKISVLS